MVEIERRVENELTAIAIKDNGRGIPPSELGHVMDPFLTYRLDSGGTGLGLCVVHGIVKEHGGEMHVARDLNVGTTIEFTLPLS